MVEMLCRINTMKTILPWHILKREADSCKPLVVKQTTVYIVPQHGCLNVELSERSIFFPKTILSNTIKC